MTKEEKKDEMKNRISLALKDPILQQGFEIICKENEKLKEANAQWEQRNVTLKDALEHARKIYGDELEKSYKENAELKEKLEHRNCVDCSNHGSNIKLTKAKGIIKKYLSIGIGGKITQNYLDVTKEAEQFINSEVEK